MSIVKKTNGRHSEADQDYEERCRRLDEVMWEMRKLELINKGKKEGIPIGEKLGEIRGKKEGKRETIKLAVRKSYHRLRSLGIDEKQALQYVCEDYPEFEPEKIRRFLDEGVSDDMFGI